MKLRPAEEVRADAEAELYADTVSLVAKQIERDKARGETSLSVPGREHLKPLRRWQYAFEYAESLGYRVEHRAYCRTNRVHIYRISW